MPVATCDVLGFLPAPSAKATNKCCQLLEGQLLALAYGSAVAVVDVWQMNQVTTLSGVHRSPVTAISWFPGRLSRSVKAHGNLRLAAGDEDGRVVVWDVHSTAAVAGLEDPWLAAQGRRLDVGSKAGGVQALAWVGSNPYLLAVAVSGLFLIWDPKGGQVLWKKELAADFAVSSLQVDPLDCRHLCLCSSRGSVNVMRLLDLQRDRVESQTYKVDVTATKSGSPFSCSFLAAPNLLLILLPREIVIFDLEYGQPAASSPLVSVRTPFRDVLGCFGHGISGRDSSRPGLDSLFCSHEDGSISEWRRLPRQLAYELLHVRPLLPPPSRINNNQVPRMLCCCAAPWTRESCQPAAVAATRSGAEEDRPGGAAVHTNSDFGPSPTSLLVVCATDGGQVWQWDIPMDTGEAMLQTEKGREFNHNEDPPLSELMGLLHTLAHGVTTLCACPAPVAVTAASQAVKPLAVGMLAAVTAGGSVELVTLQQGLLTPLQPHVSVSLGAHKDVIRGVRWLGMTSRIASFSSEKAGAGFRNTLLLTDVRNRSSVAFRDVPSEAVPMLGLRASPSGRYLLVLLRGAPAEIWLVGGNRRPSRARPLDLPFTAVEWVLPYDGQEPAEPMATPRRTFWQRSPLSRERSLGGYSWEDPEGSGEMGNPSDAEEHLEERLAFSLADGRVGILSVKGRKVTDTKPQRPVWGVMGGTPDSLPTAVAAWGHIVILGHEDGSLSRWDTRTGRTTTLITSQGTVRRLNIAAPAASELSAGPGSAPVLARLAVLFGGGSCGVWDLDSGGELRPSPVTPPSLAKFGKVSDLSWVPLPRPLGSGSVLALVSEDGSIAIVDAVQTNAQPSQRRRIAAFRGLLSGALLDPIEVSLPAAASHGSALPLPTSWRLLLSLLLQRGVPAKQLRAFCHCEGHAGAALDEAPLWQALPATIKAAWDSTTHRMSSAEAQELCMLAADRDLRQLYRHRIEGASTEEGQAQPDAGALAWSAAENWSDRPPSQDGGADARAARLSSDGTSASQSVVQAAPPVLQAVPKGTALSSLKARMSTIAKAGVTALRTDGSKTGPEPASGGQLAHIRVSADVDPHQPAPLHTLLATLASMRADGNLMHPHEWLAYEAALKSGSCAERMAVAAAVTGSREEAAFWRTLPAGLASLRSSLPESFSQPASGLVLYTDLQTGISAHRRSIDEDPQRNADGRIGRDQSPALREGSADSEAAPLTTPKPADTGRVEIWSEALQIAESQERVAWHERMARTDTEQPDTLQERRVLEYIALGDSQTAVGFLLASTPDRSARYYRDALCTMVLAASSTGVVQTQQHGAPESVSRTLQIQAAKVVAAHAASVGDTLLGVPLLCSAGLTAEAVTVFQDAGLWSYAATLAAQALPRPQQTAALERWAMHIHQAQGSLWRALGVLTAAGALRTAVLLLRRHGLPDCAAAYVEIAAAQGFATHVAASDAGGLENWQHLGSSLGRQRSLSSTQGSSKADAGTVAADFDQFCIDVLQHL